MITGYWLHVKTGNRYWVELECIDCTNGREDTEVVLYREDKTCGPFFVREKKEFLEKFERYTYRAATEQA